MSCVQYFIRIIFVYPNKIIKNVIKTLSANTNIFIGVARASTGVGPINAIIEPTGRVFSHSQSEVQK